MKLNAKNKMDEALHELLKQMQCIKNNECISLKLIISYDTF